jgi:hypothetical protein
LDIAKEKHDTEIMEILQDPCLKMLAKNCFANTVGGVRLAPSMIYYLFFDICHFSLK